MTVLALVIASAALIVAAVAVGQSRTDAGNCARDARSAAEAARNAAAAAREAARSAARSAVNAAELPEIPPGAMPPTIPIDIRRGERELRLGRDRASLRSELQKQSPRTSSAPVREIATPGAGADDPRAGRRAKP